jgi:hypothetical protein
MRGRVRHGGGGWWSGPHRGAGWRRPSRCRSPGPTGRRRCRSHLAAGRVARGGGSCECRTRRRGGDRLTRTRPGRPGRRPWPGRRGAVPAGQVLGVGVLAQDPDMEAVGVGGGVPVEARGQRGWLLRGPGRPCGAGRWAGRRPASPRAAPATLPAPGCRGRDRAVELHRWRRVRVQRRHHPADGVEHEALSVVDGTIVCRHPAAVDPLSPAGQGPKTDGTFGPTPRRVASGSMGSHAIGRRRQ